jgi:hypothetical protein
MIVRQGTRTETEIICYDPISELGRVPVVGLPDESLKDGTVNVLQYLNQLLSLQTAITWGTLPPIASDLEYPYDDLFVENTYILPSLHRVRDMVGGMLWVDNNRKLHWYKKRFPTPPAAFSLELGRNASSIKRRENRLHDSAEISYEVECIDLSQISGEDDGMLNIGMPVDVDGDSLYITDIKQSLSNPLQLTLSVSTSLDLSGRPPDAIDMLVALADKVSEHDRLNDLNEIKLDDLMADVAGLELAVEPLQEDINSLEAWQEEQDNRLDALENGLTLPYGDDIQDVGEENDEGDSNTVARANHIHKGLSGTTMVAVLPEIPTSGCMSVIWGTSTQITGGTGDGKKWTACEGYDKWLPDHAFTTLSGDVL